MYVAAYISAAPRASVLALDQELWDEGVRGGAFGRSKFGKWLGQGEGVGGFRSRCRDDVDGDGWVWVDDGCVLKLPGFVWDLGGCVEVIDKRRGRETGRALQGKCDSAHHPSIHFVHEIAIARNSLRHHLNEVSGHSFTHPPNNLRRPPHHHHRNRTMLHSPSSYRLNTIPHCSPRSRVSLHQSCGYPPCLR